ncbi:hypothetical protein CEXT_312591 [Caerostris extrusa]|uniref:Uncharacterized protein n=1 Tax=Caerostris extrusa TaxID=172846 RepID=A0AAV4TH67_CAEEX|nr:hypothetical protein CEXT_312591 [Caerostris extrusa]
MPIISPHYPDVFCPFYLVRGSAPMPPDNRTSMDQTEGEGGGCIVSDTIRNEITRVLLRSTELGSRATVGWRAEEWTVTLHLPPT